MDTMRQAEADRVYEDFEPDHEWDKYNGRFTVTLPGFRKDQLKVQVTSKPALRLTGQRHNFQNKWRRFELEFPLPSDYDTDSVTATFEGGKLTVKFAKLTTPEEPEDTPTPKEPSQKVDEQKGPQEDTAKTKEEKKETNETTNPPEDAPGQKETSQKADEQEGAQVGTPKAKEEKAETKTNEVSDQNTALHKEKDSITEKSKTEASMDKVAEKVRTNGSTEKTDAATSKVQNKAAKFVSRTKTRLIDFTKALSNQDENENEALGDSTRSLEKWKKLVAWVMLILLVVGIGLYCRNTFGSSQGVFDLEDVLLFPY